MDKDWIERKDVQKMFLLTTKQFGRVLRNIKRRHRNDYFLWIERVKDNKLKMYINKECVEWLRKVYFNKEVLDLCQVFRHDFLSKPIVFKFIPIPLFVTGPQSSFIT